MINYLKNYWKYGLSNVDHDIKSIKSILKLLCTIIDIFL